MVNSLLSADACLLPPDAVLTMLGADARHGLSSAVAERKLVASGANAMPEEAEEPLWKKFLAKLREPMIALLLASAGISLLTGSYDDSISIAIVRGAVMRGAGGPADGAARIFSRRARCEPSRTLRVSRPPPPPLRPCSSS